MRRGFPSTTSRGGSMMNELCCPPEALHRAWDNSLPPALAIDPGDSVIFYTIDAVDGRNPAPPWATPRPPSRDLGSRPATVRAGHPLCGPILVRGAQPGDTLAIAVLSIQPHEWGWTAIAAENGLLGRDIAAEHLVYWDLRGERASVWSHD